MAFWSGEKLLRQQQSMELISPFFPDHVECASYELALGGEAFITEERENSNNQNHKLKILKDKEHIIIPQGQFAFLMSDEIVSVPSNAIGFISIKAGQKFKGLINVSGFHVDPGWKGKLIFSVYNAGPMPVNLKQGDRLFLIWYSDLDDTSVMIKKPTALNMQKHISSKLLDGMNGQVFSPLSLNTKIDRLESSLTTKVDRLENQYKSMITNIKTAIIVLSACVAIGAVGYSFLEAIDSNSQKHKAPQVANSTPQPQKDQPPALQLESAPNQKTGN